MKRFIAGASCPKCSTSDSLYFESKNKDDVFCSRCDYQDHRSDSVQEQDTSHKESEESRLNTEKSIKWH